MISDSNRQDEGRILSEEGMKSTQIPGGRGIMFIGWDFKKIYIIFIVDSELRTPVDINVRL